MNFAKNERMPRLDRAAQAAAALAAVLLTGCRCGFLGEQFLQRCPERACQCQRRSIGQRSGAEDPCCIYLRFRYADGTSEEFTLEAQAGQTLAEALQEAGLISAEEAEAGFVTEVNGVKADFNKDPVLVVSDGCFRRGHDGGHRGHPAAGWGMPRPSPTQSKRTSSREEDPAPGFGWADGGAAGGGQTGYERPAHISSR